MKAKRISSLRQLLLLAIATSTVWAIVLPYAAAQDAVARDKPALRAPYLALGTPQSMTVVWRTDGAIQPVVRIGATPQQLNRAITGNAIKARTLGAANEPLSAAPPNTFQYEATISGLTPATKYYYAVYDGEKLIAGGDESYHFTTHPLLNTKNPFRFWVVGDSGTGGTAQANVHTAMRNLVEKQKRPLDLYLHVGDMAYGSGTDDQFHNKYFKPYEVTLRNVVCWPSMGNHEGNSSSGKTGVGPYYDAYVTPTRGEAGGLASGTEAYYSFDYANAHFICLNSHDLDRTPTAAMARWLKADLEATRADWIIAFWHHPPYSKGTHDSDGEYQLIEMRQHIMPILESAGVDLVLTGHSHVYERSMLMDGAYGTPTIAENFVLDDGDGDPNGDGAYRKSAGLNPNEGTVQVVAGHGGTGVGRHQDTMPVMKRVFVEHGSVIVDVAGDTLTAIMLNFEGRQRDLFSIVKRGKVTPKRIANPKQLPDRIDYGAMTEMLLPQIPAANTPTKINLEVKELPAAAIEEGAPLTIEWDTTGTSWQVEPKTATVKLSPGRTAQHGFTVSRKGELFPLPTARTTFLTEGGEELARMSLALPSYKRASVTPMKATPTIDGVLSEQELAGLTRQSDLIIDNGSGLSKFPTDFYLGLHENKLYVAVVNHEPEIKKIRTRVLDIYADILRYDSNAIFIQRQGQDDYYVMGVDATGKRYDSKRTDATWEGEWSAATKRGTDRWITELLIPLDILGQPIQPGDVLRFNLIRNNRAHGETSQWSFTNRSDHRPEYFGTLTAGGK
ncbi:MAG TPA: metallophosphoesterase [Abditibacteriaceae bacterium]|nr:metallophosphoesterase [Abditibacteriaceae bacterium]